MSNGSRITIDLSSQSTEIKCECGSDLFREAFRFRKVSKILTASDKDTLVPLPAVVCLSCGKVNEELSASIPAGR